MNDLIEDVGKNRFPRLRYSKEWLQFLKAKLPESVLSLTHAEFEKQFGSVEKDPLLPDLPTIVRDCMIYFSGGELAVC